MGQRSWIRSGVVSLARTISDDAVLSDVAKTAHRQYAPAKAIGLIGVTLAFRKAAGLAGRLGSVARR